MSGGGLLTGQDEPIKTYLSFGIQLSYITLLLEFLITIQANPS